MTLLVLLVIAALFTPTSVVAWQLWTSRMSGQRRSRPPVPARRVAVPTAPMPVQTA